MNFIRNDRGYILVLTLIVITVLSLFSLSFIQISANQNKQVEQTSDTFEVTSIAEMGVEYYTAIFSKEIENYNRQAYNSIDDLNKKIINSTTDKINYESELKDILSKRERDIENKINSQLITYKNNKQMLKGDNSNLASFYISDSKSKGNLEWNFEVTGNIADKKEKLLIVSFEVPELNLTDKNITLSSKKEVGTGTSTIPPMNSIVTPPSPIKNKNVNIANHFKDSNYKFENAIDLMNNVKIHAEGNIHLGNLNNMNGLELIANKDVKITQPNNAKGLILYAETADIAGFNSITNSYLQINGNSKFNNIEKLVNTKINILGNASVFNKIYMDDKESFININGTLTVTQANSELSQGTIIVNKLEYADNNGRFSVNGTGKFCVKDISSIGAVKGQRLKGTASARVYFLDTSKAENYNKKIVHTDYAQYGISNGDVTGNQMRVLGIKKFKELCSLNNGNNDDSETIVEIIIKVEDSRNGTNSINFDVKYK